MQIKYKLSKSASTHVEAIRVIRCTLRYSMALNKSIPAQQFADRSHRYAGLCFVIPLTA